MDFLNNKTLGLNKAGYLVKQGTDVPVTNEEFVYLQNEAHYLISLANEVKKADFTVKKVVTFDEIKNKVASDLNNNTKVYVKNDAKVAQPMSDKLKAEALNWLNNQTVNEKNTKINALMQKFNVISDFEAFGLYFSDGLSQLKKIYTIDEIVEAISVLEPHLSV